MAYEGERLGWGAKIRCTRVDLHYWPPISDLGWRSERGLPAALKVVSTLAPRCAVLFRAGSNVWLSGNGTCQTGEALYVAPPPLQTGGEQ